MFYVCRDGEDIGEWDKAEFDRLIRIGEILPSDHYFAEGMADWEPVSSYWFPPASPLRSAARTTTHAPVAAASTAKTNPAAPLDVTEPVARRRSPAYMAGMCLVLAFAAPLLAQSLFFLLSLPLFLAALVLAVVALVRGQIVGGIVVLLAMLPCFIGSCSFMLDRERWITDEGRQEIIREAKQTPTPRATERTR